MDLRLRLSRVRRLYRLSEFNPVNGSVRGNAGCFGASRNAIAASFSDPLRNSNAYRVADNDAYCLAKGNAYSFPEANTNANCLSDHSPERRADR